MRDKKYVLLLLLVVFVLFSASYATVDGVYHTVRSGDTLWGISKAYKVGIEAIRQANPDLSETNIIKPGQRIFIPKAESVMAVAPPDRQMREILRQGDSDRWKYMIIHHSATAAGSARLFDRSHRKRGFRTMGYHFVIGNGTDNSADGEIETGLRWRLQWEGAHTSGNMNYVGIGICLVGNFENSAPTRKQMESLVRLVTHLAYNHNIALANIRGHKDCVNNTTKCPGKYFPWEDFKKSLAGRGMK